MTLTRAQWGARAPKEAPIRVSPASRTGTAIHHDGATPITVRTLADVVALIRRDQAFHMDTRGWNDIGYNWLVISAPGFPAIDGLVVEGRGRDVVGAHCEGHNTEWVGIQVATGGDQEASPAALKSARALHDDLERAGGHPMAKHTHSDGFNTECPGGFLTRWVRAGMPAAPSVSAPPKDWFDMATPDDLRAAVKAELNSPDFLKNVARFVMTGFAAGPAGSERVLVGHLTQLDALSRVAIKAASEDLTPEQVKQAVSEALNADYDAQVVLTPKAG